MKFTGISPKTPEVERCASKDAGRPILTYAYLRITGEGNDRQGFLETTDSYKLVQQPVILHDEDVEGFIQVEALKAKKKASTRYFEAELICREQDIELVAADGQRSYWQRPKEGTWPSVPSLIPQDEDLSGFVIGINAHFLSDVAKALGSKDGQVEVRFVRLAGRSEGDVTWAPSNLRPFVVTARNSDGKAICMPVKVAA